MESARLVKVQPFSKRMKNRVSEHGELMLWVGEDIEGGRFLLKSLRKTWGQGEHWLGWATFGEVSLLGVSVDTEE